MEVLSTVGLGGLLGAWQFARLMWPHGPLYNEPWVVLHPVLVGVLATMLLLGGLYRRRAHSARTEIEERVERQITQLTAQRDAAWEIATTAMKTGIEVGHGAGYDKAQREARRRARLRAS